LTAAEELSQTGECDASDICSVAAELESHVAAFAARVQARRRRLQRAVNFYTHQSEVKNESENSENRVDERGAPLGKGRFTVLWGGGHCV